MYLPRCSSSSNADWVLESFFSKSASDGQKFSGFMIFQKMIEGGSGSPFIVDTVFSKNFMACLINQASKEDRYLHRAALKALKTIETTVQEEPSILDPVLKKLLGSHGAYNFDQRTNTKTVEKLLQYTTTTNVEVVLDLIKNMNNLELPLFVQAYGNYLFKLASLATEPGKTDDDNDIYVPALALQELARITYSKADAALSDQKTRDLLRNRLTSAFAKFVRRPEDFSHLCNAVLLIEADVGMAGEIESELVRALERLRDLLDCEDVGADLRGPYHGLALLHAVGVLQLYNEDPDALETLADLEQCYDKLKGKAFDEDEGVTEFLVEILLSMVAQPSSLMRQLSQQVFEAFTSVLSAQAIQLLTDPLTADENAKGQQALFSTEDEDMDGAEGSEPEGSDHESLDSDVEIVDLEDAPSDPESDASDNESDSGSEGAESVQGEGAKDELDGLDDALAEVLKSHRLDKDAEAESSDDSDMSDSEMMELDDKLVEIFKQRAKTSSKKKDKKDAKESVINFKHRVLDLLAIFIKKEAATSNPLVFQILLPLLQLVRTTTTKPLANKACDIVLTFAKGLKKSRANQDSNELDADALMALLRDIHADASKDPSHLFARAASSASLAVASVLCASTGRAEEVFQLYAQSQLSWYRGEVKMQPSFFADWLNWCQGHASNMAAQGKE